MGRPRKFNSVKSLEEAWDEYKQWCNNQIVLTHEFSSKNSEFVSKELKRSITYTIDPKLSGLWTSKHGYGTKSDSNIDVEPVVIVNDLAE